MGYSKALLNLLKGTQQGVSYVEPDSNAAKNNSNENVKQAGSSQPVNYKVTNAVSFLAAQNLGISTDSTGTPHISNPSDGKKFMEECDRLRENEDKIMAAAAAGISVDRDGNPRPQNTYEETAYKRAYELLFGNDTKNVDKKQEASGIQLKYNESYDMDINTNAGDIKLTTTGGVGAYNGRKETYYSQRKLPGNGLQIPGRHVSSKDGTIRDKDGYIVVAADLSIYPKGTILECSLGPCKVYDTGVTGEHLDIYCDWMDGIEYSDMTQEQRNSSVTTLKGWLAGER